jgi:hypothetical protein
MTQCIQETFKFQGLKEKKIEGRFDGGTITSDAGGILLREVENKRNILKRFSECFTDHRDQDIIEHSVKELISQRVYGIALGYEDLNDHDILRLDPLLAVISGKEDPFGQDRHKAIDKGKALAGRSTLNRLELTPEDACKTSRYKKIVYKSDSIGQLMIDVFLESFKEEPKRIVLDLDATDDIIHGEQEGRFFHGYYGNYCYLPLYIFSGDFLLCAKLRTSNRDASDGSKEEVDRIVKRMREKWPNTQIILRGDSGFAREEIMVYCEENGIDYIFGLAKNNRLNEEIESELAEAKRLYEEKKEAQRVYKDFTYKTLKSWSRERRVIGKAEQLDKGSNPRFVVTSLKKEDIDAKILYETEYCARGNMENRIKEQQLDLFADRTSAESMRANQLRLWFSSFAYIILKELRRLGLRGTEFIKAQCQTIRNKLLKIGAQVSVSARRIFISFASGYPYQDIFRKICCNLQDVCIRPT